MTRKFETGVTLLGGGEWREAELAAALANAPALVCADGAANDLGKYTPDIIIGDLDSLDDRAGWSTRLGTNLVHDPDQDTTDFEKCIALIEAPFIIGVGFLGGRIDHELAVLSAITATDSAIVLLGEQDLIMAPRGAIRFAATVGQRVSVFPLAALKARSTGLKWPLDGLALAPGGRIATSNEANETEVKLEFDGPGGLVILPREQFPEILTALPDN